MDNPLFGSLCLFNSALLHQEGDQDRTQSHAHGGGEVHPKIRKKKEQALKQYVLDPWVRPAKHFLGQEALCTRDRFDGAFTGGAQFGQHPDRGIQCG